MARGQQAAAAAVKPDHQDGNDGGGEREQKANKRRCVQSACQPCRKRKSKCDGGLPVCATCTAVYKTACSYDAESESRRAKTGAAASAGAKRDSSVAPQPAAPAAPDDNAEFLLSSIRTLPESEVYELVQQIRKDARLDVAALAESWRKTVTLPPALMPSMEPHSLEGDLSMLLGKPTQTYAGESRYFGHTSGLSLIPEDENYTKSKRRRAASAERKPPTWTAITQDIAFVQRLLDLYFRWSHPFYVIFSRECFYRDFRSGREKYCSPMLVNAVLAYGCHYTDEPAGRTDPDNFRTAGDHFFEEARRLLHEDETPSLTTMQALCVMAMREPSAGRDSSGFMYMGRCMRMGIELGLHLNNSAAPAMQLTPAETEVRKVTFWGCFTVDTVWSICVGRISQLPRAAITVDKPILDESPSGLHPEGYPGAPQAMATNSMFLQEFSTLSELINDNNMMFFAPKERFTSRRLLECYNKYEAWYKNLPPSLRLEGLTEPQPHIIVLHMLYHTTVIHLFRPMLKVDLIHSNVRPRDTCIDAANQVAELLRLYRQLYSMRTCQLLLTHILLSANIVHLLYSAESQNSYRNLVEGLKATDDMTECHYFGKRGFKIVHALSKIWNLPFPEELHDRKAKMKGGSNIEFATPQVNSIVIVPRTQASHVNQTMGSAGSGYSPIVPSTPSVPPSDQAPMRRESLTTFARPNKRKIVQTPPHPAPAPSQSPGPIMLANDQQQQEYTHPQHRSLSQPHIVPSYATSSPAPTVLPQPQPTTLPQQPTASQSAETLFWTPVPGMGTPILPRTNYQVSPMDIDNMIGHANEWDRFFRDGFKMSDQWQQDPMAGTDGFGVGGVGGVGEVGGVNGGGGLENYHTGPGTEVEGNEFSSTGQDGAEHYPGVAEEHGSQAFDAGWWVGGN
ncbi:hypothetical protein P280DRAFT_474082 [Massarina eburnea CBS 473.64]|uniref:Zn(2)-C6 fungal-type domain-containing protein n=1 Tax=Massarina eburnea CBS 473.64 TaxID=1395130 RepID=A0A6A6RJA3_9PLEO|nr:hypothetical protein P280DRAFT_474082 [Massarina eburnea CBS 473.64]